VFGYCRPAGSFRPSGCGKASPVALGFPSAAPDAIHPFDRTAYRAWSLREALRRLPEGLPDFEAIDVKSVGGDILADHSLAKLGAYLPAGHARNPRNPNSWTAATSSSPSMGKPRFGARKSRNTRGMGLVSCRLYAANRSTDVFAIVHAVKMNLL
jgi:hypothetical protein